MVFHASTTDLYAILEVPHSATEAQLKDAYRRMVRAHHPDANPMRREEAERLIKTIIEAYGVLGDPEQRARYDNDVRLAALDAVAATHNTDVRGVPKSLLGRVRGALDIDSHELAGKLGLADAVLLEMERRDAIPTTPVQLRTFANLCRRAASELEGGGRHGDADELREALGRKMAQRAVYR